MIKIFLGGTCEGYDWRKVIEDEFKNEPDVKLLNPVVSKWAPKDIEKEKIHKDDCDLCIFVLTPFMPNTQSALEAYETSLRYPTKTVFVCLDRIVSNKEIRTFTKDMKSWLLDAGITIEHNGGYFLNSLADVIKLIKRKLGK